MTRFAMAMLLAAIAWGASANARTLATQTTRASQGVYTAAQASRGSGIYADICVACHSLGRFRGADFAAKWADKPLATLFTAVKTMPLGEPGSLEPQEYADVVAYLLSVNTYPASERELPPTDEAMAAILLDAKAP